MYRAVFELVIECICVKALNISFSMLHVKIGASPREALLENFMSNS